MEEGFSKERESARPCWLWRRRDGVDPGISYMTEKHIIIRIDIFTPAPLGGARGQDPRRDRHRQPPRPS